jgi:hypothetical protein
MLTRFPNEVIFLALKLQEDHEEWETAQACLVA